MNRFAQIPALLTAALLLLTGCASNPEQPGMSNKAKGAAIGAAVGTVVGLLTGDDAKERRQRALAGAGIGALAGTAVGAYMDAQERKLRDSLAGSGVRVTRDGDRLNLHLPSNLTFDTNSSAIKSPFYPVLNSVAVVLGEYPKTYIDVAGHTDSVGANDYNQTLSVKRAEQVASYLAGQSVLASRVIYQGYGEDRPIADNDTAFGREQNRRVELTLAPITR